MYDYRYEPHRVIFMIDNKSFYASCEALRLGLNPMEVALAVVSQQVGTDWGSAFMSVTLTTRQIQLASAFKRRSRRLIFPAIWWPSSGPFSKESGGGRRSDGWE